MSKSKYTKPLKPQGGIIKPEAKSDLPGLNPSNFFITNGFYLLVTFILLISFFVYRDFLFFKNVLIYKDIGSDTYNLFNPQLVHFTNYLRTEGIPKWSFNQGMGQNVFPGGINDPFNIFLYLFEGSKISYLIVYAQLIKILLGGIIFYYYLKTIGITPYASLVGALLFSFSGYMILGGGWYGHSSLVVYGAFLLFSFEKLYKQNSWFYFPVAVAILSTDIFSLYIFTIFLFLYVLFRYYQEHDFRSTGIIKLLLKMVGFGLLGIAINSVFLVSPLLQMIDSPRVSGEAGYFNLFKSMPLFGLADTREFMTAIMRSFSSDMMYTGSDFRGWQNYLEAPVFYAGLINLLLVPQVFQFLNKKSKILFGIFFGLWFLLILFPYFRHSLYLFSGDYYKSGMSFFVPVTALFFGISALSYIDKLTKINFKVLLATFIALIVLLFFSYLPSNQNFVDYKLRSVAVFFLIMYAFVIYLLSFKKFKYIAQIFLLLILICELAYFSSLTVNKRSILTKTELNKKIGFNDYTVESVNYLKSIDKSFYRINKNYFSGNAIHGSLNDAFIQDYYGTSSYQSFNQLYYIKFLAGTNVVKPNEESETRWAIGLIKRPLLQTFANIKYTLTKKSDGNLYALDDSIASFGDVVVFKNKFYLPLGYSYNKFILQKDFEKISILQKDKTLFQAFVIDENQKDKFKEFSQFNLIDTTNDLTLEKYGQFINELKKDTLAITEHSQNLIKGRFTNNIKKLLFFTIPYDQGWQAVVDGKKVEPLIVNFGFMGFVLDKGVHDVVFEFEPPYVKESLWVSLTGLLIYLLYVAIWVYKKKNQLQKVTK